MTRKLPLDLGAVFMFVGALFHVACLFGGADWLAFAGAPAELVESYRQGEISPIIWTLLIALLLAIWGFYAVSGNQRIRRLPLLKTALALIALLMIVRGAIGMALLVIMDWPWGTTMGQFHAVISVMIFGVGLFYAYGVFQVRMRDKTG